MSQLRSFSLKEISELIKHEAEQRRNQSSDSHDFS